MKIAVIQTNVVPEKQQNLKNAEHWIEKATQQGANLILLPEMFNCPYQAKNFPIYAEEEGGAFWKSLSHLAKQYQIYLIAGSIPELSHGNVYNTSFVFDPQGNQIAKHRKMHLFDIDVAQGQSFRESDTLTPGDEITVFETTFGKFGLCICYDIRFPELSRLMALQGAKAIFVPGAFNLTTGPAHWEILFRTRALDNQVYTFGAAPARNPAGPYVSYGNSIAVSPWGTVLHRLEETESMFLCNLDLEMVATVRQELPLLAHRRTDLYTLTSTQENQKT